MQTVLDHFAAISSTERTLLLAGGLLAFWILEGVIPLYRFRFQRLSHAVRNLFLMALQLLVGFSFAFLIVKTSLFASRSEFGLFYLLDLPLWLKLVAGLLLFDLIGAYLIHWLQHKIPWLWSFHLIHHTDQQVDVTTGLRHHPIETAFRSLFTVLAILVIGAPIGLVFLYQSLSILFAHFSHANVRTPESLDRWLSAILVTPRFHRVHHHFRLPYTDSNYGNIFSIWDRIFGTAEALAAGDLRFGIDTHLDPSDSDQLINLLALPFRSSRGKRGSAFTTERKARPVASNRESPKEDATEFRV